MRSLFAVLSIIAVSFSSAGVVAAQNADLSEGFVVSLRSLYEAPDANSNTVGFLRPGEYVRLEHVHSLVYRVYRDESSDVAGYVVYPKLSEKEPERIAASPGIQSSTSRGNGSTGSIRRASDVGTTSGSVTNYAAVVDATTYGEIRWVHQTSNIRSGTGTDTDVVAQLPRGSSVRIGTTLGTWTYVYRPTAENLDPSHALGFVHSSLLKSTPPPVLPKSEPIASGLADLTAQDGGSTNSGIEENADASPPEAASILQSLSATEVTSQAETHEGHEHEVIVFVTKTGTKYHLETCRHLRKSKRQLTLKEAKEKNYEACKTCKPDKKLATPEKKQETSKSSS